MADNTKKPTVASTESLTQKLHSEFACDGER